MLFLTLKGTPFFFAGDELGRERGEIPKNSVRDIFEKLVPGYGLNRDPERVPMAWDASENHGFTTGEPWLPMIGIGARNVADLQNDNRSILHLYKALIRIRKEEPALCSGEYLPLRSHNDILVYERFADPDRFTIALNLTHEPRLLDGIRKGSIVLSTLLDRTAIPVSRQQLLRPDEGIIIQMD